MTDDRADEERRRADALAKDLLGRRFDSLTPDEARLALKAAEAEVRAEDLERALLGQLSAEQCFR